MSCLRRGGGVFTTSRWVECVLFEESGWVLYYPKVGSVCPVWGEGVGSLLPKVGSVCPVWGDGVGSLLPQGWLSVSCLGWLTVHQNFLLYQLTNVPIVIVVWELPCVKRNKKSL